MAISSRLVVLVICLSWLQVNHVVTAMLVMKSDCLPACNCSWKSGKFVADCQDLKLKQVPKVSVN